MVVGLRCDRLKSIKNAVEPNSLLQRFLFYSNQRSKDQRTGILTFL